MTRAGANPFAKGWAVVHHPRPGARKRLLCFPYAGGGASIYRDWGRMLPADVEVVAVQLPGREGRLREAPFTSMVGLVDALVRELDPWLEGAVAFFGHSMGALVAFELARRVQPALLVVSGHGAPNLPPPRPPVHDVPDDAFASQLRTLGGTPDAVLAHPELMELLLPLLRADFELCECYAYAEGPPLSCPLSAMGAVGDPLATREQLEAWRRHTTGPSRVRQLPGGHFFLLPEESQDLVLRAVAHDLAGHW